MNTAVVEKEVTHSKEKKKRKDRRRRRGSSMEEINNNVINRSGPCWMENKENMLINPNKTKIYEPLEECLDLNIQKEHLHYLLQSYILCEKQLVVNKYPRPHSAMGEAFSPDGLVRRKCFRCKRVFHVSLDGKYDVMEECNYHPERCKISGGSNAVPLHPCCNQPRGNPGCTSHHGHVCADPILHNAKFKSVRDKRCIRQDQKNAIYALDCEMVFTSAGLQVAKIGVVNHQGLTIYETFVLPENQIIDYNTAYSGITAKDLKGVTTTLADVQTYLDHLLNKDSILIGHALNSDLKVLRLLHDRIIDTSVMFPRVDGTKQKLKDLAYFYLNKIIQNNPNGHDCIEDARTCMALVLHKLKLERANFLAAAKKINTMEMQRGNRCQSASLFPKDILAVEIERNVRRKLIHEQIKSEQSVLWIC